MPPYPCHTAQLSSGLWGVPAHIYWDSILWDLEGILLWHHMAGSLGCATCGLSHSFLMGVWRLGEGQAFPSLVLYYRNAKLELPACIPSPCQGCRWLLQVLLSGAWEDSFVPEARLTK